MCVRNLWTMMAAANRRASNCVWVCVCVCMSKSSICMSFFLLYSPWMRSASEMEIWLFDPGHQAERSRKTDQERGIERERLCMCLCVCVFFFNPFHTPHLFFCFRVCGYSLMCFLSSCAFFLSFPFLQCTDKHLHLCLFFLPLLIFSPFALHSHRATGSLPHFFFFLSPKSVSTLALIFLQCQTSRDFQSHCRLSFLFFSTLLLFSLPALRFCV